MADDQELIQPQDHEDNASNTSNLSHTPTGSASAAAAAVDSTPSSIPRVIRYGYSEYVVLSKNKKCTARCNQCNKIITETEGVTTAFTK